MAVLSVPRPDPFYPTLGPQVAAHIEEICVFGPGSLQGEPAKLDKEKRKLLYRAYEVYPRFADGQSDPKHSSQEPHPLAGMRHFNRVAFELRKGVAKTEFAAWICYEELHPGAPVRFDHWSGEDLCELCEGKPPGKPCGRAVVAPFIPLMATAEEQVQELAYGVLKWVIEHSKDAWMFDIGLERIIRYGDDGTNNGMAMAVSSAPNNRDGARTTFEHFDEPHRLFLPLQKQAHETMIANLPKRPLEDPWALYTSTAGNPGQGSVEEDVRSEAEKMEKDPEKQKEATLFFFARWASDGHDLSTVPGRVKAIAEATGPVGEWGQGQFLRTAKDYDREGVDRAYWERVWLNRWRRSGSAMFNPKLYRTIPEVEIPSGAFVCTGFDGARRKDSTAMVITEIETGRQQLVGLWEAPDSLVGPDGQPLDWQVPISEVGQTLSEIRRKWEHWKLYGDPPYWTEEMASWAALFPDEIVEFWTNQNRRMAYSIRAYLEALESGACQIVGTEQQVSDLLRHLGSAGRRELNITDDQGKPLYVMQHMDGRLADKYDAAMAGCLSWTACLEARRKGARPKPKVGMPRRIR